MNESFSLINGQHLYKNQEFFLKWFLHVFCIFFLTYSEFLISKFQRFQSKLKLTGQHLFQIIVLIALC